MRVRFIGLQDALIPVVHRTGMGFLYVLHGDGLWWPTMKSRPFVPFFPVDVPYTEDDNEESEHRVNHVLIAKIVKSIPPPHTGVLTIFHRYGGWVLGATWSEEPLRSLNGTSNDPPRWWVSV